MSGGAGPSVTPEEIASALVGAISRTVRGKPEAVRLAVTAILGGGHLLIDDLPGTGKTLLGKSMARAMGGRFGRVQCTPDLLPSDLTGSTVFLQGSGEWEFRAGPVFANVVLVDEINRATPRTQSALLEPMEEGQVTVDGATHPLPSPYLVIATQNPLGQAGTFPLPESQLDRFALVLTLGLPDRAAERDVVTGRGGVDVLDEVVAVTTPPALAAAVSEVRGVHVADAVVEYLLDLTDAVRADPRVTYGPSARASSALLHLARAHAVVCGRRYVTPDDIVALVANAYAHRLSIGGRVDTGVAWQVISQAVGSTPLQTP